MSKDAITQVALAEKEAEKIRRDAEIQARALIAEAQKQGQAELERVETETAAQWEAELGRVRAKAATLLAKSRDEAEAQADEKIRQARRQVGAAVKHILGGLNRQWQ